MSELEKKWWFSGIVGGLTTFATLFLMSTAGLAPFEYTAAQWAVWFLCFVGLQRCISFLGWLTVLMASPKTITAGRK
ncbi:hypothetical protein ABIB38_000539 [Massilia sp. UYP11]|uniref:hypothetical protein n=1 Tax=Massilia sp. UYP11 TaxID=1756385 RepID=UPI003D1BD8CA